MPHARGEWAGLQEMQVIGPAEWRAQQEQDTDLQQVLQWVESGQRPPWNKVAGGSTATNGLYAGFEALLVSDGELQRAEKESAAREDRRQGMFPRALREALLKTS